MSKFGWFAAALLTVACSSARAEMWGDFSPSNEVWTVIQMKVRPDRIDQYLSSLHKYFVPAAEAEKRIGTLEDYQILVNSVRGASGATVIIMEKYTSWAAVGPNKERDLKLREEIRKIVSKEEQEKVGEDRSAYRSVLEEGMYFSVQFGK